MEVTEVNQGFVLHRKDGYHSKTTFTSHGTGRRVGDQPRALFPNISSMFTCHIFVVANLSNSEHEFKAILKLAR